MKKTSFIFYILLLIITSCNSNQSNYNYQSFNDYGFEIKAPCVLKDVSTPDDKSLLLNYGGCINENFTNKLEADQLMVTSLPEEIKVLREDEAKTAIIDLLTTKFSNLNACRFINFSDRNYIGLEAYAEKNGIKMKGLFFVKDGFIISLVTMTNNSLEEKHDKFINSIRFWPIYNKQNKSTINDDLLNAAIQKGFERGKIEHCINDRWSTFADKDYYRLKGVSESGMMIYEPITPDNYISNMEVHVLNDLIKLQTSNISVNNQTKQIMEEMNAWLLTCNPLLISGDIKNEIKYEFNDITVILKKLKNGYIEYTVKSKENKLNSKISLTKETSNNYFTLKYPSSWQIVMDDNQVTNNTTVSIQIMQKRVNDYDFCPNINIIVSSRKWNESSSQLATTTIRNNEKLIPRYKFIKKTDNISIGGYNGSLITSEYSIDNCKVNSYQYIIKKPDNTVFIISATVDTKENKNQMEVINTILNSIIIK